MEGKSVEMVRERVKTGGMLQIPLQYLGTVGLAEGDEVYLWTEAVRLVVVPAVTRKRLRLDAEIVNELVEHEDLFEPEILRVTSRPTARCFWIPTSCYTLSPSIPDSAHGVTPYWIASNMAS
jgi:bifunctional DNA-binding transcriptional regulator/antitoxin component of YhaV-PrlF toxin-antitoxin module